MIIAKKVPLLIFRQAIVRDQYPQCEGINNSENKIGDGQRYIGIRTQRMIITCYHRCLYVNVLITIINL